MALVGSAQPEGTSPRGDHRRWPGTHGCRPARADRHAPLAPPLHNGIARHLRRALRRQPGVVITTVPLHLPT